MKSYLKIFIYVSTLLKIIMYGGSRIMIKLLLVVLPILLVKDTLREAPDDLGSATGWPATYTHDTTLCLAPTLVVPKPRKHLKKKN